MSTTGARPPRGPHGRVWLYAIAFVLLLVAGWLQVKGNLNSNLQQVGWSIGLSVAAVVVAVASVVVPGRRLRTRVEPAPAAPTVKGNGSATSESEPTGPAGPEELGSTKAVPSESEDAHPSESGRPPSS